MLAKKERLNRAMFSRFFAVGKRYHSPHFQLIYSNDTPFQGSVVVGKKVFKKAVLRNRLRRQVYGVLMRRKEEIKMGVYIIVAKPSAKDLDSNQVINETQSLLNQV